MRSCYRWFTHACTVLEREHPGLEPYTTPDYNHPGVFESSDINVQIKRNGHQVNCKINSIEISVGPRTVRAMQYDVESMVGSCKDAALFHCVNPSKKERILNDS
jgi:hypothetical protein